MYFDKSQGQRIRGRILGVPLTLRSPKIVGKVKLAPSAGGLEGSLVRRGALGHGLFGSIVNLPLQRIVLTLSVHFVFLSVL